MPAGKTCRRFRQSEAEALVWQKRFDASFTSRGGVLPSTPAPCSARWTCDQCDRSFASKKALAAHSARVHGYRRLVALYAVGDTCQACCKLFHARSRLTMHLRDAGTCLETLRQCYPLSQRRRLQLWTRRRTRRPFVCAKKVGEPLKPCSR